MNRTKQEQLYFNFLVEPLSLTDILLVVILAFGLVGNGLSILVMRSRQMRGSNAAMFVILISVLDTVYLILRNIGLFTARSEIYMLDTSCIYKKTMNSLIDVVLYMSVWMILLSAAERTAAVMYPLTVTEIFSKKRCIWIITILFISFTSISVLFYLPCFTYSHSKRYCIIVGGLEGNCYKIFKIFTIFRSVISAWLPSVLVISLNSTTVSVIYKAHRARKKLMNQPKKQEIRQVYSRDIGRNNNWKTNSFSKNDKKRQMYMLLALSITFVILTTPYSIYEILRRLGFINHVLTFSQSKFLLQLFKLFLDINHSTNILCCMTARRFREELKRIILCQSAKENRRSQIRNLMLKEEIQCD